jgi:ribosome biogenesis SPOUT family RNA methylase Rps3
MKFIIEHLDPRLWKWSYMEYKHISDFSGKENVIFSNIRGPKTIQKLSEIGKVYEKSVKELNFENACILDPNAEKTLSPEDNFDYLIMGGILGDNPPQKRTEKEITSKMKIPARNLGKRQMSTNTAAYVALKISQGIPLEKIEFEDQLVIKVSNCEEIILDFPYVKEKAKLVLPEGYIEMAKKTY